MSSKKQQVSNILELLATHSDCTFSKEQLQKYLDETQFECRKATRAASAYSMYLQDLGKKGKTVNILAQEWKDTKKNPEIFTKYQKLADEFNATEGFVKKTLSSNLSTEEKRRIEQIKKQIKDTDDVQKPIFVGPQKSVKNPTANFKQWVKNENNLSPESTIPREEYNKYKDFHSYDKIKYENAPWKDFIINYMAYEGII